jgi:hypothetical protein
VRPYPPTGLTTQLWIDTVPVRIVPIELIILTQEQIGLHALLASPATRDPYPNIVLWEGLHFLEDGNHRFARAFLRGATQLEARVYSYELFPLPESSGP